MTACHSWFRNRFASRVDQREIFDDPQTDQVVVDRVYRFLTWVNRRFGGAAATIARFEAFSTTWRAGERIDVLDIACGAADIPRALVQWGRRRGFDVRVTAVDISPCALDYARRLGPPDERLQLVCADISRPFCREGSFDYVTSALFFHHLTDAEVVAMLGRADQLARRGLVINDLVRSLRAFVLTWLVTWPFDPILHHDGPLSVRRALTAAELEALAHEAGLTWLSVQCHFAERMTLAEERQGLQ